MSAPGESPMLIVRERARRRATQIVSGALGLAGISLVVLAVMLVVRGGAPLLFLSVLVGAIGIGVGIAGFFFQLVPLRIDELAEEKREHDARMRKG